MSHILILCRSLTQAQRLSKELNHSGMKSHVQRTPRSISPSGCGYCVSTMGELDQLAELLNSSSIHPRGVYVQSEDGSYMEVAV